jgi:type I restriction enzyme, S subunit
MKAYSVYKDSHFKFLGNIPSQWNVKRAKYVYSEIKDPSSDGSELLLSVSEYYGVKPRNQVVEEGEFITRADSLEGYKKCQAGDLVMNIMLAWKTGLGVTDFEGIVSPSYAVFRPIINIHSKYLHYLLRINTYVAEFKRNSTGIIDSRLRLYPDDFLRIPILLPSLLEQQAIANFLDCKTAQIDTLIEKKQRQIDLLREQRAALINHAVTKGLNPNVREKDPLSEFYPLIPEHWTMTKLGYLCNQIADGPHYSPEYVDEGILFISARNVKVDRWQFDDAKYITEVEYQKISERIKPEKGDVLYTKGGTTGVARAVDFDEPFQVWVHIIVLKLKQEKVDPFFLAHALNSVGCYDQSQLFTRGATNNDLGVTRVGNIVLGLPPLNEQIEIVNFLRDQTQKIDLEIKSVERMIDLIKEYRTALISEAVTGKIDVREWRTVHE